MQPQAALDGAPSEITGLAALAQLAFDGADLTGLWADRVQRAIAEPADAGALIDLSTLLLLRGQQDEGLGLQQQALQHTRLFRRRRGDCPGLRVLALVTTGNLMANTPLDFLLDGSDIDVDYLYVGADAALPDQIPDHDLAFFAIGESTANREVLKAMAPIAANWPRPMVNAAPERIAALTRDGVCAACAAIPQVLAPATRRMARADVTAVAAGAAGLADHLPGAAFPIIIRPIDSHAGQALSKIDTPAELAAYLDGQGGVSFYVSQFVDYSGPDGLYRKQRIALIDGRPFISHMAVSEHWMVHYLNARMAEVPERRAEEAAFMAGFDTGFAARHAEAFAALHRAVGLDYFAIDCAETRDGRLLLFEADVAMIIHAMDSEDLYPYKRPAMRKLFAAFQACLAEAAARAPGRAAQVA